MGCLLCIILMARFGSVNQIFMASRALLLYCVCMAAGGAIDFAGKLVGAGDLLAPIRTASYAFLTLVEEAGFYRIAGTFSEASGFAGATLAAIGYVYPYWRQTNSRAAMITFSVLLLLLLASTSSSGIVGLGGGAVIAALFISRSALKDNLRPSDITLLAFAVVATIAAMTAYIINNHVFDSVVNAFNQLVLNKQSTSSGQERAYMNVQSFNSLLDTMGLGVGLGSSRSSSWLVAALSQLGIPGAILFGLIIFETSRPLRFAAPHRDLVATKLLVIGRSAQCCALYNLLVGCIAAGNADPGYLFYICIALVAAVRSRLAALAEPAPQPVERQAARFSQVTQFG
jgi:hypothetical protein